MFISSNRGNRSDRLQACLYVIKKNEGAAMRAGSSDKETVLLSLARQSMGTFADGGSRFSSYLLTSLSVPIYNI